MTQTTHGGPVEYIVAVLLVLQLPIGGAWLKGRYAVWPRTAFFAAVTALGLLWAVSTTALGVVWSGSLYTSNFIAVGPRTAIVAVGYFWIILSTFSAASAFVLRSVVARIPRLHSPSRRRWMRAAGLLAASSPVAAAAYGVIVGRNQYRILELDLPVPGLHPDLDGYRIVQVSDLHVSPFLSPREAGRVIDMANELRPDLAVFTGDLISEMGDPLRQAIRELIRLRAGDGVLGCMGNHEHYVGCRNFLERQARLAGMNFLRNAATRIHRGQAILNIAGVDFQRYADRLNYLPGTESLIVTGASNVLLSHTPDVFPTAIKRGFQTVLSGHTHGGQVNVEILHQNINPARFHTPFTSGLYRRGQPGETPASCFVTNGIGTIGLPIRLGAPPEIALLRLRRA